MVMPRLWRESESGEHVEEFLLQEKNCGGLSVLKEVRQLTVPTPFRLS